MLLNWEGRNRLLLRACRMDPHQVFFMQLPQLLQPRHGRFLNTVHKYEDMQLAIKRMTHALKNLTGNLAQSLRTTPQNPRAEQAAKQNQVAACQAEALGAVFPPPQPQQLARPD